MDKKTFRLAFTRLLTVIFILVSIASITSTAYATQNTVVNIEQANEEANNLNTLGLFAGTAKGYELERAPTRIEGLVMLIRMLGEEQQALNCSYNNPFTDVPSWASKYAAWAYSKKYTTGTSATTFSPSEKMKSAHYITFMLRALGYGEGVTLKNAVSKATEVNLIATNTYDGTSEAFFRADMVHISYLALQTKEKTGGYLYNRLILRGAIDKDKAFAMFNPTEQSSNVNAEVTGELKVSFIDVGQADSILIQNNNVSMLIDAGNNGDASTIVNYLKEQGVSKLDNVIGTHPHEDHIGSMDAVINTFNIGKIYMPKATATTKTYEDVLLAIKNKGLKITTPTPGSTFALGGATFTILAPNSDKYEDLNNYSIVIKLEYGKTSFLFTGDAEMDAEQEMMSKQYDLKSDVLKVGHHGSNSSSSTAFLKAVSPKYAVISVGKDNDYGHPTQVTLDKLADVGIQVFRTDEVGTIVATSDGETIKFNKNASAIKPQAPPNTTANPAPDTSESVTPEKPVDSNDDVIVYITKTGTKYHVDGCQYLSNSKIPISLSDAIDEGYAPCSKCNPPK